MIEIIVERVNKNKECVQLKCNGSITGNRDDIRREMAGALMLFDEVAEGEILCDALEEFLKEKISRKMKGANDDD